MAKRKEWEQMTAEEQDKSFIESAVYWFKVARDGGRADIPTPEEAYSAFRDQGYLTATSQEEWIEVFRRLDE